MLQPDKFIKTTGIIAKMLVRLFFILLLVALTLVVQYSNKPGQLGFVNLYQWRIIFPVLLILGFVGLLVTCTIKKYKVADLNVMLIINTVMLMAYGIVLFFRISAMIR